MYQIFDVARLVNYTGSQDPSDRKSNGAKIVFTNLAHLLLRVTILF